MTLDRLQVDVLQLVSALPEAKHVALAGGGAMLAHGLVERRTADVDLFTPDPEEVRSWCRAVGRSARAWIRGLRPAPGADLLAAGHTLGITTADGRQTAVEIAVDARLRPSVRLAVGSVLDVDELAADKVLALFGRAAARDLVDVQALAQRYQLAKLLELAAEKDRGFNPQLFAEALLVAAGRALAAFRDAGVSSGRVEQLRAWARDWSQRITAAEQPRAE